MFVSQTCLDYFKQNKMDFKHHFITVDDPWIHHYTSEQKHGSWSKQWIETGGIAPKKANNFPSASKVITAVF